jgi:hypothetical protein
MMKREHRKRQEFESDQIINSFRTRLNDGYNLGDNEEEEQT